MYAINFLYAVKLTVLKAGPFKCSKSYSDDYVIEARR